MTIMVMLVVRMKMISMMTLSKSYNARLVAYLVWPIKAKHADPLGQVAKCHHDDDHDYHDVNDPLGQVAKSTSSGVAAVIRELLARM